MAGGHKEQGEWARISWRLPPSPLSLCGLQSTWHMHILPTGRWDGDEEIGGTGRGAWAEDIGWPLTPKFESATHGFS